MVIMKHLWEIRCGETAVVFYVSLGPRYVCFNLKFHFILLLDYNGSI